MNDASIKDPVAWLNTTDAVRHRAHQLLQLARQDSLPHFKLHPARLPEVADFVVDTIKRDYPELNIPYHSRWRHFEVAGQDRAAALWQDLDADNAMERARIAIDLVIPSVLLDAGAGDQWRYTDRLTGNAIGRSEGLALASLDLFRAGYLRDAGSLQALDPTAFAAAFQISGENPLIGVAGRVGLMHALGAVIADTPLLSHQQPARLAGLLDHWLTIADDGQISVGKIFASMMQLLLPIWPARLSIDGQALGDAGRHHVLAGDDPAGNVVPFHKLTQWLTYSLLEPLQWAGLHITDLDSLTGLGEYRNGGLFVDLGALQLRDTARANEPLAAYDELVVEWRALTIALLDELAPLVRARLGLSDAEFPLAKLLQGGTWSAGRRIAKSLRPAGGPPLTIASDGTVF